jgi:serine/threonine protein phosphatase PrpC
MKVRASSVFLGKGARPAQEDHALALREKGVFVVADGFGGPVAGAAASKEACEAVRGFLVKEAGDLEATLPFVLRSYFSLAGNVLFNALVHANRKVVAFNKGKNANERGGASVLAAFLDGDLLALAGVGICTGWLLRGGKAIELVTPRSYGKLCDPFAAEAHEQLRIPLMAVGMADDLEPEIFEYRIRPGDWLVLHSDGIGIAERAGVMDIQSKGLTPDLAVLEVSTFLKSVSYVDNTALSLAIF